MDKRDRTDDNLGFSTARAAQSRATAEMIQMIRNPDMANDPRDIYGTRWSPTAGPGHPPQRSARK